MTKNNRRSVYVCSSTPFNARTAKNYIEKNIFVHVQNTGNESPTSLLAPTRIVTRTGITKINFDLITSLDDEHFSFCACYLRGSILLRRMGKCQDKNDDVEVTVVAVLYVAAFLL